MPSGSSSQKYLKRMIQNTLGNKKRLELKRTLILLHLMPPSTQLNDVSDRSHGKIVVATRTFLTLEQIFILYQADFFTQLEQPDCKELP